MLAVVVPVAVPVGAVGTPQAGGGVTENVPGQGLFGVGYVSNII